jgi:large subunit ribosomal protein L6
MSRIGKQPVNIPDGVNVAINPEAIEVTGKLGTLVQNQMQGIQVTQEENALIVKRTSDDREIRALHGLMRSLLQNMVNGVSGGYTRTLDMIGVGYRARVQGNKLVLSAGYSHDVEFVAPEGIAFQVDGETAITVRGIDKQQVGQVAADIRRVRKPEPYKGKGIKYREEVVRRKAGKTGK